MSDLLNSASLVMIPSGYKEDTVYSVVPSDGSGDLSFTRASNGTRINSAGLVEVVAWNLAGYSEDFSNAYWNKSNSPVMAYNVATAPNGTMTADSIQSNSASVYQSVAPSSFSIAPNSTFTLSIYIKKETSKTYFTGSYLYFTGGTTKLTYVLFDEVNGTINIVAPDQVSMVTSVESVGDWWRFIVTGTDTGSNTQLDFAFYGTLSQNGTSLSPGIGSARTIYGAQLNIGATAKPYFPTTDRLNVPRLTYQNGGGGCPSLLLEKQSTNSALYSPNFTTGWTLQGTVATANNTTSPDGTQNADKLENGSASNQHRYFQNVLNGLTNQTLSFSIYAKQGTHRYISWGVTDDSDYRGQVVVDLQTGTITDQFSASATLSNLVVSSQGNGWYRISGTIAVSTNYAGGNAYAFGLMRDSASWSTANYTGTNTYCYVWGAQIEQSSYTTSYIPTTSSSATRVADACFKTGISSLIGGGTGTWFMDFEMVESGSGLAFAFNLSDGTSTNHLFLYWDDTGSTWKWGGTDTAITLPSTLRKKVAIKYSSGTAKLFCNGSSISTLSIGTAFTRLDLGNRFSQNYPMDGKINQAYFLTTSLTDAECQAITTI